MYGDLFVVRWKKGSFPAAFKNIITAVVTVVVVLILLKEILDINVTSLIATTTVLTATIGLAFQSTLANMLAGLTIHLEKPLKQGDWISAGGHEGHVLDITLRSTRIMTIENNEVFIPNSKVLSEAVVNYSLPDAIDHQKAVGRRRATIYRPTRSARRSWTSLPPSPAWTISPSRWCGSSSYGDFSVNYEVRYTIHDFQRHRGYRLGDHEPALVPLQARRHRDPLPDPDGPPQGDHGGKPSVPSASTPSPRSSRSWGRWTSCRRSRRTERRKLVETVGVKDYAAGELPVRQGDAGDSFYIIKKGVRGRHR